jgi:hypothetical protein
MIFKGTKGNWRLANNEYGYYTSVRNLDDTRKVCVSRVNNQIESNANMLLISKAPEMLEMLKRLVQPDLDISDLIEAEKLIKEATITI